ncbi:MAG: 3-oxoadipate enol-lactonase [Hyphomicrobiales bacterium]|nr:3-oxoadipate enol-lactonase [Hyphomicrobiales bacterium]
MADMKIGDEIFNVEVEGPANAPPLILSNSLGSDLHMWDPQMPALTRHFRVIRYDSRGHGKSVASEGPYSFEQLGRDALAILDGLGVEKASWMGLSKGGGVGQWLLVHAPDRIERAVLANTAAKFGAPDVWNERLRVVSEHGLAGLVEGTIDRWFTKSFQQKNPDAIARIRESFLATPAVGWAACSSALRDVDLREAIRAVRAPVLVVVGKHDQGTPPAAGREIADAIPGARLVELDAAHLSNVEAAEAFNRAVVEFLTEPAPKIARPKSFPHRRPKKAAKKAVVRPEPRAAKKAAKKTAKKAAKKAGKKIAKKAARKAPKKSAAKKAAKKGVKKGVKKAAGKPVKKAAKRATKKGRKR